MDGAFDGSDELARRDDSDDEFRPRQRRWVRPVAWVVVVALVLGAGFSSALALLGGQFGQPKEQGEATAVSALVDERGTGSGTLVLQTPPESATGLAVGFTCLTAGDFSWGIDPAGNPGSTCTDGQVGSQVWREFELPKSLELYIEAERHADWAVEFVYISRTPGEGV